MRALLFHPVALCLLAATGRVGAALDKPGDWSVRDAPYRAPVKAGKAPEDPKIGWALDLPEFGPRGPTPGTWSCSTAPARKSRWMWSGEGPRHLFCSPRECRTTDARCSISEATRRAALPHGTPKQPVDGNTARAGKCDPRTWPGFQAAWKLSPAIDGAGFEANIYQGSNPFGDGGISSAVSPEH